MVKKTGKKINKNLFLPEWLIPLLDMEGERFGGPGIVASAAIYHLLALPVKDRIAAVDAFHALLKCAAGATRRLSRSEGIPAKGKSHLGHPVQFGKIGKEPDRARLVAA